MTMILQKVLGSDKNVQQGSDSYINDIAVNLDVVSCEKVMKTLNSFGLVAKDPEYLENCRILGLRVQKEKGLFKWRRDNEAPNFDSVLTRRDLFSLCGKLVGHYPRVGWLRPACSYIKRMSNELNWDDQLSGKVPFLVKNLKKREDKCDPLGGLWNVSETKSGRIWCDASSLASGVVVEIDGVIVEDQCWLRKNDDGAHINVAELEAVVKGIWFADKWNLRDVEILTDSSSVYAWLRSIIGHDQKVKTCGLNEIIVRQRLELLRTCFEECGLNAKVTLVPSHENKAD